MKKAVLSDEAIRSRLERLSFRSLGIATCTDGICLARHGNANWLCELQDLLEEIEIPVEDFAAASYSNDVGASAYFVLVRGRLRMADELKPGGIVTIGTLTACIRAAQTK